MPHKDTASDPDISEFARRFFMSDTLQLVVPNTQAPRNIGKQISDML